MNRHKEVVNHVEAMQALGWKCGNQADALVMDRYRGLTLDHTTQTYYYIEDETAIEPEEEEVLSMDYLCRSIFEWAADKGILKIENRDKQMLKVMEEVGETASALAKDDRHGLIDGIGDVMVTLIILAAQNNLSIKCCLAAAYEEIKDRTGKTVNGVFIKD